MAPKEPPGLYAKQRRAFRHDLGAAVELTDLESGRTKVALVRALNSYGCFVKTDIPFRAGARVALKITHKGSELSVSGRVVVPVADRTNKGIGVEFSEIDSIDRERLDAFLADLVREDKSTRFATLQKKLRIHTATGREARDRFGDPDTPRYAWQQTVMDAFRSSRDSLPAKINAAERAISARLADTDDADIEEQLALKDALHSLRVLLKETSPQSAPAEEKKDTA